MTDLVDDFKLKLALMHWVFTRQRAASNHLERLD